MSARVEVRQMTSGDIAAGMRLKDLEGWNQTESDWQRFLQFEPGGCFVADHGGNVCGTVTALSYGTHLGWVGMVLVDPDYRHQGIGTMLLDQALAYLDRQGIETVKLDATPKGRSLYLTRGFAEEYEIERWEGTATPQKETGMRQITPDDIRRVCACDAVLFGGDRARLLTALWQEAPDYTAVAYSGSEVAGYFFGRTGRRARYLGPWVAGGNRELEQQLLVEFLNRSGGERVFVDICLAHPDARSIVEAVKFSPQRKLTRMYRGPNRHPGKPSMICAIAGPEFG
jgi:GNAT superfamily N-acetyltransferase